MVRYQYVYIFNLEIIDRYIIKSINPNVKPEQVFTKISYAELNFLFLSFVRLVISLVNCFVHSQGRASLLLSPRKELEDVTGPGGAWSGPGNVTLPSAVS